LVLYKYLFPECNALRLAAAPERLYVADIFNITNPGLKHCQDLPKTGKSVKTFNFGIFGFFCIRDDISKNNRNFKGISLSTSN